MNDKTDNKMNYQELCNHVQYISTQKSATEGVNTILELFNTDNIDNSDQLEALLRALVDGVTKTVAEVERANIVHVIESLP